MNVCAGFPTNCFKKLNLNNCLILNSHSLICSVMFPLIQYKTVGFGCNNLMDCKTVWDTPLKTRPLLTYLTIDKSRKK